MPLTQEQLERERLMAALALQRSQLAQAPAGVLPSAEQAPPGIPPSVHGQMAQSQNILVGGGVQGPGIPAGGGGPPPPGQAPVMAQGQNIPAGAGVHGSSIPAGSPPGQALLMAQLQGVRDQLALLHVQLQREQQLPPAHQQAIAAQIAQQVRIAPYPSFCIFPCSPQHCARLIPRVLST